MTTLACIGLVFITYCVCHTIIHIGLTLATALGK